MAGGASSGLTSQTYVATLLRSDRISTEIPPDHIQVTVNANVKTAKQMIQLKEFTNKDFDRFINWIDNEKFMYQFAGPIFTFPITEKQLTEYLSDKNRQVFKIIEIETEKVIGHAEIGRIDLKNKSARLCRILVADKADRNKGFGTLIINKLLEIGFENLNLHRLDLGVFDFNKSAIRCYEKCGFKIEGLLRESFVIGDEFLSVYNMSILKDEWKR